MSGFFLGARRWSSMGLPAHVSNLPKPRSSFPVGTELLFLKASQSPLLLSVSHPTHSARWVACLAEQGWGAGTLLLTVPTVSFWKEQALKIDSRPRRHWLVTFWASSRKWNLKVVSVDMCHAWHLFFSINIQCTIYHFDHFYVYSSVALSAFMWLYNHHHHPSPELFHLPKLKLCMH